MITTSWDDGYPDDFRIAELLEKYNVQGTFYIPRSNEAYPVMTEAQIRELAGHFEIGGHTIHHVKIDNRRESFFEKEILGCYNWLGDLLGEKPISFCFPCGVYNQPAVAYTLKTGFKVIRTTELLNPTTGNVTGVVPTTLQVYNHSSFTYFKHLLKRLKFQSIGLYLGSGSTSNLMRLVDYYLEQTREERGCFHLWGHSWEIDNHNLWEDLEQILKLIGNNHEFKYVQNRELLN